VEGGQGRLQQKRKRALGLLTYTALDSSQAGEAWISAGSEAYERRGMESGVDLLETTKRDKGGGDQGDPYQKVRHAVLQDTEDNSAGSSEGRRVRRTLGVHKEGAERSGQRVKDSGWHVESEALVNTDERVGEEQCEQQQDQRESQQQQMCGSLVQQKERQKEPQQLLPPLRPCDEKWQRQIGKEASQRVAGNLAGDQQPADGGGAGPLADSRSSRSPETTAGGEGGPVAVGGGGEVSAAQCCSWVSKQQQLGKNNAPDPPQAAAGNPAWMQLNALGDVQQGGQLGAQEMQGEQVGINGTAAAAGIAAETSRAEAVPLVLSADLAELDLDPTQAWKGSVLKGPAAWKGGATLGLVLPACTRGSGRQANAADVRSKVKPVAADTAGELYTAGPVDDLVLEPTQQKATNVRVSSSCTADPQHQQQVPGMRTYQDQHDQRGQQQEVGVGDRQHITGTSSAVTENEQALQFGLLQQAEVAAECKLHIQACKIGRAVSSKRKRGLLDACHGCPSGAPLLQANLVHEGGQDQEESKQVIKDTTARNAVGDSANRLPTTGPCQDQAATRCQVNDADMLCKHAQRIEERQAAEGALKAAVAAMVACPHLPGMSVDSEMVVQDLAMQLLQWVATGHKQHEEQRLGQQHHVGV
jgi:hypothetical protein